MRFSRESTLPSQPFDCWRNDRRVQPTHCIAQYWQGTWCLLQYSAFRGAGENLYRIFWVCGLPVEGCRIAILRVWMRFVERIDSVRVALRLLEQRQESETSSMHCLVLPKDLVPPSILCFSWRWWEPYIAYLDFAVYYRGFIYIAIFRVCSKQFRLLRDMETMRNSDLSTSKAHHEHFKTIRRSSQNCCCSQIFTIKSGQQVLRARRSTMHSARKLLTIHLRH